MIPKGLSEFVSKLYAATTEEKVRWTASGDRSYFCVHNGITLNINYHFDSDNGVSSYLFHVVAMDGNETWFSTTDVESDFNLMRRLFEAASVNAFQPDQVLKDFFK